MGQVIVPLDYTGTENGLGCLDIIMKPQLFFFHPPEGFSNSSLSLFHTLQSKMQLIGKTRAHGMRDGEEEESREIMQLRLNVMDR